MLGLAWPAASSRGLSVHGATRRWLCIRSPRTSSRPRRRCTCGRAGRVARVGGIPCGTPSLQPKAQVRGDVTNAYMFLLQARGTVLRHGTCRRWTRRLGPSPWAAGRRAARTSAKSGYPARACHVCTTYMDEKGYAGDLRLPPRRPMDGQAAARGCRPGQPERFYGEQQAVRELRRRYCGATKSKENLEREIKSGRL